MEISSTASSLILQLAQSRVTAAADWEQLIDWPLFLASGTNIVVPWHSNCLLSIETVLVEASWMFCGQVSVVANFFGCHTNLSPNYQVISQPQLTDSTTNFVEEIESILALSTGRSETLALLKMTCNFHQLFLLCTKPQQCCSHLSVGWTNRRFQWQSLISNQFPNQDPFPRIQQEPTLTEVPQGPIKALFLWRSWILYQRIMLLGTLMGWL